MNFVSSILSFVLAILSFCLGSVPSPQSTATERHPPHLSPSHPFLLPPFSCPSSLPTHNLEVDLRVMGSILIQDPTFKAHCRFGLPEKLGKVWNNSCQNKGLLHTIFALPPPVMFGDFSCSCGYGGFGSWWIDSAQYSQI